jgi:hypothetical protein
MDRVRKFSVLVKDNKSTTKFNKSGTGGDNLKPESNFILTLMNKIPTISPTNYFLTFWDLIHLFSIIFCTFYVPIEWVSYLNFSELYGFKWIIGLLICLLIFVINIFI